MAIVCENQKPNAELKKTSVATETPIHMPSMKTEKPEGIGKCLSNLFDWRQKQFHHSLPLHRRQSRSRICLNKLPAVHFHVIAVVKNDKG